MRPKGFVEIGREALVRVYGNAGRGPAAEAFLADADAFLREETKVEQPLTLYFLDGNFGLSPGYSAQDWVEHFMIHRFAMSCNVIAAHENGEMLEYAGMFDPLGAPCSNQLSVFYAPD
jgi:hypothetical protein